MNKPFGNLVVIFLLVALFATPFETWCAAAFPKTRMIMMADMGNEPDEMQQNVHMLIYSNMFDLEGLCAVTGLYLKTNVHPEQFTQLVTAYGQVYPNLQLHASGWPTPTYLQSIVKGGVKGYGKAAVGSGKSSDASNLIKEALIKNDPRPIYFVGNAGTNNLLQALWDLDAKHFGTKTTAEMIAICKKIIVYENGSQDDCGAWIAGEYPDIAWFRSNGQTYSWGGDGGISAAAGPWTWDPFPYTTNGQDVWAAENIRNNHGALGALYPQRNCSGSCWFLEGGGTTPWTGLANHGLTDPEKLWWGGWGGRFSKTRQANIWSTHGEIKPTEQGYGVNFLMYNADSEIETWTDPVKNQKFNSFRVPVWRFRRAMWNDEKARMDWCIKPFAQANHNPVAAVNGDAEDTIIAWNAKPGQVLDLDATGSTDPDMDSLSYHWWIYNEAGTYPTPLSVADTGKAKTTFTVPANALGKEIHVILEVEDKNSITPMYDYRRIVISVGTVSTAIRQPMKKAFGKKPIHFMGTNYLALPAEFAEHSNQVGVYDLGGRLLKERGFTKHTRALRKNITPVIFRGSRSRP